MLLDERRFWENVFRVNGFCLWAGPAELVGILACFPAS
jgi:hypothetical protein